MVVTVEQINAGIVKYIDNILIPKANTTTKFMIYFFVPSIPKYVNAKVAQLKEMDSEHEFFNEDGNIKLDDVYNRAKTAIEHSGKLLLPKINYFMDAEDLDTLYSLIKSV